MGTGRCQVTDGVSCLPTSRMLPERSRICITIVKRTRDDFKSFDHILSVRKVAEPFGARRQVMRVTQLKCLQRSSQDDRAARKGTNGLLSGVESWSSEVRVIDGELKPNPENWLHYCLLLSDREINNRGEGDEGFNTPVCRLCGVERRRCEGHHQSA